MRHHHTWPGLAVAVAAAVIALVQGDAFAYTLNSLGAAGGWDDINKSSQISTVIDVSVSPAPPHPVRS